MSLTAFAEMFPDLVSPLVRNEPVNLYVDISGLVRSTRATNSEELLSLILHAVKNIVDRVSPRLLYVAFDGSLPLVKLVDQRRRNYKEASQMLRSRLQAARTEILAMAGTKFMHDLQIKITDYFKDTDLQYELSPMSIANEGVCKIASAISKKKDDVVHLVSGTDFVDAFLESALENKNLVFDILNDKTICMSSLRQEVTHCVSKISKNSPTACLQDISFIAQIRQLGPLPACTLSLDEIIAVYGQSLQTCKSKSLRNKTMKLDAKVLKTVFAKMQQHSLPPSVEHPQSTFKAITTRDEKWRSRYWKLVFNIDASCVDKKRAVIKDYCKALIWLSESQVSSIPDWQWFYGHDAAPPLQDVIDYIEAIGDDMSFIKNRSFKPFENLAMGADHDGLELLPTGLRDKAKSPTLAHFYPEKVETILFDKQIEIFRMPYIEPLVLVQAMKSTKLTAQEKERNKLDR